MSGRAAREEAESLCICDGNGWGKQLTGFAESVNPCVRACCARIPAATVDARRALAVTKAMPGSFTASAKVWSTMVRSPRVTLSVERKPEREPEPYWMAKAVPFCLYVWL